MTKWPGGFWVVQWPLELELELDTPLRCGKDFSTGSARVKKRQNNPLGKHFLLASKSFVHSAVLLLSGAKSPSSSLCASSSW